ncbi:MAG: PAS domain-containing protein, partial [Bauldia litoralis]
MSTHSVIGDIRRRAREEPEGAEPRARESRRAPDPGRRSPPETSEQEPARLPETDPDPAPEAPVDLTSHLDLTERAPSAGDPEPGRKRSRRNRSGRNRFRRGPVIRAALYSVLLVAIALAANYFLMQGAGSPLMRTLASFITIGAVGALIFSIALRGAWRAGAGRGHVPMRERLIRDALDSVGQPRAVFDPEGTLIHANTAFSTLFRRQRAEGLDAIRLALGGNRTGLQELDRICNLAVTGIRAQAEFELREPTGASEWRRIEAVPIEGHPGHFVIWADEPPPDTNLIEHLRAEQRTFADFLENAPIGFYSVDENGRFVYMNETLANWLGVTPKDLTDGKIYLPNHLITDGPLGVPYDPFGGESGAGEGEAVMRDMRGRQFPVQIIQRIETGPAGLRTRSIVRDLTPERLWQRTLQQTRAKIESLLADSPVGVAVLDFDGFIREMNPALRAMLGAEGPEYEGAAFGDLLADDAHEEFGERFEQVLQGRVSGMALEVRARLQQGSVLSIYLSRFGNEQDEDAGVIVQCLDLSEQRQLETQIAHSQKMQAIGQLAGGVAHDFNNLLTAMIGYCDLLLMRHRPGEQSFADITQIKQNANRAADLVRQLLAFSRQQTLKPKVLSITDVLTDLSHLLRRLVGTNIQLKLTHGRDLGRVRVDQGQFEQVVINLAVNARDAMAEGGKLTIRTMNRTVARSERRGVETIPPGDYIVLEVTDSGIGIAPQHIDH